MWELILFLVLGVVVYLLLAMRDKRTQKEVQNHESESVVTSTEQSATTQSTEEPEECCGQHLVCERDSLLSNAEFEYYDDEELDVLAGVDPADYSKEEIAMLQSVFYTLRESDVAGWVRSLQMRNIQLTPDLREEALLIVRERRSGKE